MAFSVATVARMSPDLRQLAILLSSRLRRSGSSFRLLIRLLSPALKHGMTVLYLYCRAVDDCADDGGSEGLRRLAEWQQAITGGQHPGDPDLARALWLLRREYALPDDALQAVIDGCRQDLEAPLHHPQRQDLDLYCDRVAGAVGILILCLCGFPPPALAGFAESAGRALQYTNILRDLAEDAARGRCYLPADTSPEVLADEAERLFRHCRTLTDALPPDQRRRLAPAVGIIGLYHPLLAAVRQRGFSPAALHQPVKVRRRAVLWVLVRMIVECWR